MKKAIIMLSLIAFFLSSAGFALQSQEPVDPVDWRELQKFLVDLPGFEKDGDPEGETVNVGEMKWTHVEQNYTAGDQYLTLEIVDSAYVAMALQSFKMATMMEIDTSDEYMKKVDIDGHSGVKTYTYADKDAMVMVLAADRFLVRLEGEPFEDADTLVDLIQNVDLQGLASIAE